MAEWSKTPDDEVQAFENLPTRGTFLSPAQSMQLACEVALKGAGWVNQNPLVGAVAMDKDHKFIAAGAHLKSGEAHAEANIIREIEKLGLVSSMDSATIYVTLEPCCFRGKTPGCAQALLKYPIKKIVYGVRDSHPRVSGKGLQLLEDAGIPCHKMPEFEHRTSRLSERSLWFQATRLPFIGLKAGLSFDGRYAFQGSSRVWLTNERARKYGHWLRQIYDAILVGPDTLLADNPSLNIRSPLVANPNQPIKVILDSSGRALLETDLESLLILKSCPDKVLWCLSEASLQNPAIKEKIRYLAKIDARHLECSVTTTGHINLEKLLESLGKEGITSLLIEGGAGIWQSFLKSRLVQRAHIFQSFETIGPSGIHWTQNWSKDVQLSPIDETIRLTSLDNNILIESLLKTQNH